MDAEEPGAMGQGEIQLERQISKPIQPTTGGDHSLSPCKRICDFYQRSQQPRVGNYFLGCRPRPVAKGYIPVGVAANELRIGKCGQLFKHMDRIRTEGYEITEDPVIINPSLQGDIVQHRLERDGISVDIGKKILPGTPVPGYRLSRPFGTDCFG
jgi:hypothetical protein